MPRVKLTDRVTHGGRIHEPGAELELTDEQAERLIGLGVAERPKAPKRRPKRAAA
ncbi:MAG: DUF7210 family protein [Thermoanaerobaculia bacterium]